MRALHRLLPLTVLSRPRTVAAALGVLLALWAITGALHAINDPDVWWIAAAGRVVRETGTAPTTNGFSFTEPDRPWVMHEWAYAPLYELGLRRVGPSFFALLAVAAGLLTAILSAYAILRDCSGRRTLAAGALATLVALLPIALVFHGPRPSMVSLWIPVAVATLALRRWSWGAALGCVALEWAWTQLHGSFPIGLGLLGLAAVAESDARARRVATVVVAALVTVLNPYGLRLHALVFGYGAGISPTMKLLREHIVEFRPIWGAIGTPWLDGRAVVALVIVLALAVSAIARRRDLARALFVLALLALATMQARHWTLAALLGAVLLAPEVGRLLEDTPSAARDDAPSNEGPVWSPSRDLVRLLTWAVVPALVAGMGAWVWARASRPADAWISASLGGGSVARLVRDAPDGAHVWAPFEASAVVMWEGAPRGVRVFFDPRNDCYGADTWDAFLRAMSDEPNGIDALVSRGTTHAIVPSSTRGFETSRWTRQRVDGDWTLYVSSDHVPSRWHVPD
jgi:hypothetical protein